MYTFTVVETITHPQIETQIDRLLYVHIQTNTQISNIYEDVCVCVSGAQSDIFTHNKK